MADPILRLQEIDATLSDWTSDTTPCTVLSAPRQASLGAVGEPSVQLSRSLARQANRRWHVQPDDTCPDKLQAWPDRMGAVAVNINRMTPAQLRDSE